MMRSIKGFPEYSVTTDGRVFSRKWGKFKELKPFDPGSGYLKVRLYDHQGNKKTYFVHRLVMETFIGVSDLMVNHIDGVKTNNKIDNLEYVTAKGNDTHARENNLKGKRYKLTPENIEEVIKLKEEGLSVIKIAKKFSFHRNTIYKALEVGVYEQAN